mmetsp:Transcript_31129/g.66955  ORF Transcript_31129/g.66955 Transcript_31129/m.66955 type:complete len:403 (+) Transcript_31129:431-1639(+)
MSARSRAKGGEWLRQARLAAVHQSASSHRRPVLQPRHPPRTPPLLRILRSLQSVTIWVWTKLASALNSAIFPAARFPVFLRKCRANVFPPTALPMLRPNPPPRPRPAQGLLLLLLLLLLQLTGRNKKRRDRPVRALLLKNLVLLLPTMRRRLCCLGLPRVPAPLRPVFCKERTWHHPEVQAIVLQTQHSLCKSLSEPRMHGQLGFRCPLRRPQSSFQVLLPGPDALQSTTPTATTTRWLPDQFQRPPPMLCQPRRSHVRRRGGPAGLRNEQRQSQPQTPAPTAPTALTATPLLVQARAHPKANIVAIIKLNTERHCRPVPALSTAAPPVPGSWLLPTAQHHLGRACHLSLCPPHLEILLWRTTTFAHLLIRILQVSCLLPRSCESVLVLVSSTNRRRVRSTN